MILFMIFILIFLLFILIYNIKFRNNIYENFLVTHIKSECNWNTQGILFCTNIPDIKEIPSEQLILGKLKNKYKNKI